MTREKSSGDLPPSNQGNPNEEHEKFKMAVEQNAEIASILTKFNDPAADNQEIALLVDNFNDEQEWFIGMKEPREGEYHEQKIVGPNGKRLNIRMNRLGGFSIDFNELPEPDWSRIQFSPKTGLNTDWPNEYNTFRGSIEQIMERIRNKPVKKYFERNTSKGTIITPETQAAIDEIDSLVEELNQNAANGSLTNKRLSEITDRFSVLIYGR